jgi:hypothetical protein
MELRTQKQIVDFLEKLPVNTKSYPVQEAYARMISELSITVSANQSGYPPLVLAGVWALIKEMTTHLQRLPVCPYIDELAAIICRHTLEKVKQVHASANS